MARSTSTKKSTIESELKIALDAPVDKTVTEAAQTVGCAEIRLLEMFSETLNTQQPMGWETIPSEHEPLLVEFKNQIDSFNSVRTLEPENIPSPEPSPESSPESPTTDDNPLNEETPAPAVKPKRKRSTALTKKKSEALQESDEKAQELAYSDVQVKQLLHAKKGAKSGAALATIELAAEDATYRKIKGEALTRKVAQLTCEIASENAFDPVELLAELGIDSNSDVYESLREEIEPKLGKLGEATEEIVQNAWLNGINLEDEFTTLEKLLSSKDFTLD
jgi:hypothetical protein